MPLYTGVGVLVVLCWCRLNVAQGICLTWVSRSFLKAKVHMWFLFCYSSILWSRRLTKLGVLHMSVFGVPDCARACVCVCMCVRVSLTSAHASDCRRKGQQPDMVIAFVLILRTSLCASESNSPTGKHSPRQVSHCSCLWSSHIPLLSQKSHRSHRAGRNTGPSLRFWQ